LQAKANELPSQIPNASDTGIGTIVIDRMAGV